MEQLKYYKLNQVQIMNNNKVPRIVPFFVLTIVTSVFWAFFDVYRNFKKSPPIVVPEDIISPINPKLDLVTLNGLAGRYYVNEDQMQDITYMPSSAPKASQTPKAKLSPTPVASGSAQPSPTATASATPQ